MTSEAVPYTPTQTPLRNIKNRVMRSSTNFITQTKKAASDGTLVNRALDAFVNTDPFAMAKDAIVDATPIAKNIATKTRPIKQAKLFAANTPVVRNTCRSVSNSTAVTQAKTVVESATNSKVMQNAKDAAAKSEFIRQAVAAGKTACNQGLDLIEKAVEATRKLNINATIENNHFNPEKWEFWRSVTVCFFIFSLIGHWMEIPYCTIMSALFGIVEDDYAVWNDPLYVPYWVYGIGATGITLFLLPLKNYLEEHCETKWGALFQFFIFAVVACGAMECIIGLIINQPNALGEYPFWDNSQLPFNIFKQAWLVNDIMLGLLSILYVWVIFPLVQKACQNMDEKTADTVFAGIVFSFGIICCLSYLPLLAKKLPIPR